VVDVYLQAKRDGAAAKRFFRRLMRSHGGEPRKIVTDKLRSYGVAHRELMPDVSHDNSQYANNRAEQSHDATKVRERVMRKFKSVRQSQRFLGVHAAVSDTFQGQQKTLTALKGLAARLNINTKRVHPPAQGAQHHLTLRHCGAFTLGGLSPYQQL
jgi:transposase-like protein